MPKWPPKIPELGDIVKRYIDDGNPLSITNDSGIYRELEEYFAGIHSRKYALLCSSGTAALFSAFFALGLSEGDEVICTAFTYHATVSPALFFGVKIVFCDVEDDTGNIDASLIESLITPKTRAVITNDTWGHPCDKDAISAICRKHNLPYIADFSHAQLAKYRKNYTGSYGDIACCSFQERKMIGGGEGGILLTDNFKLYERATLFGHYSWRSVNTVKSSDYLPIAQTGFGLKLRIHPLSAAIVLHKLRNYAQKWIASREETLSYFGRQLELYTPLKSMARRDYVYSMGGWYGFFPLLPENVDREDFTRYLYANGVEVKHSSCKILPYLPLFRMKIDGGRIVYGESAQNFPSAERYERSIIGFPTFTDHEYGEIDRYVRVIAEYFSRKS